MKKAVSLGTSAALVASLLATVVAPAAMASATATGGGSLLLPTAGNTSVSAPASFTFTENDATQWTSAGSITVAVVDANGSGAGITLGGTLVPTGPDYMGVTASVSGNTVTVTTAGPGQSNLLEAIGVSGVTITVTSAVAVGALSAKVTGTTGGLGIGTFEPATTVSTVTGSLAASYSAGVTSLLVNVTSPVSASCGNFVTSALATASTISGISNPVAGVVTITTAAAHGLVAGDVIRVTSNTNTPAINGMWTVGSAPTTTTFTIATSFGSTAFTTNNNNGSVVKVTAQALTFGSTTDPEAITLVTGAGTTVQTLTVTGTTVAHQSGETVSQTLAASCTINPSLPYTIGSPATVAGAAYFNTITPVVVQPNENNQGPTNTISLTEPSAGFIAAGTALTFTLAPAGAQFSFSPSVTFGGGFASSTAACVINSARTACTFTVPSASTSAAGTITFTPFRLDLGALATSANVTLTASGVAVFNNGPTIATSALLVVASAATPTVYIGFNDQPSGQISIAEGTAGFFSSSASLVNTIGICLTNTSDSFTRAPWAVVTSGNLMLAAGSPIAPAAQAAGTLFGSTSQCAYWTVYTASTTASTIQIRGTDASGVVLATGATNGVNLSIAPTAQPGTVQAQIYVGTYSQVSTMNAGAAVADGLVGIAVRAFKNQPVVAALSQPTIATGTSRAVLGNLTITETQAGQFKPNEIVCVDLVPLNMPEGYEYQAHFISTNFTADQPVIATNNTTANPNGLLVTPVQNVVDNYFCFTVNQQATGTLGVITISNMVVYTPADAAAGNLLVNVSGGFGTHLVSNLQVSYSVGQAFEQTVSNAKIGSAPKLSIAANSALGLNPTSGYTMKTPKYQAVGKYVTWKFTGGMALAGQRVNVLVAKHINGAWGGPVYYKSAWADANGIVTFAWTSKTAAAINVRVQWPGSTAYAVSTSKALGAYYK